MQSSEVVHKIPVMGDEGMDIHYQGGPNAAREAQERGALPIPSDPEIAPSIKEIVRHETAATMADKAAEVKAQRSLLGWARGRTGGGRRGQEGRE